MLSGPDETGNTGHGDRLRLLDRSAYVLLSRIRVQGPMSIGELGGAFGLDVSPLDRQTAAAVRAGLVERTPDPAGGIARKFRITGKGERMLDEERDCIGAATTSPRSPLSRSLSSSALWALASPAGTGG
jgi:DNA-binding MarR family transcriptional regulator